MRWVVLVLLMALPACSAHSSPVTTEPPSLAGLPQAPSFVEIRFSEPMLPESVIGIYDDALLRRDAGNTTVDPSDPRIVRLYTGNLVRGIYTISYRTTSAIDGHYEEGGLAMTIGVPGGLAQERDRFAWSDARVAPTDALWRTVAYVGLALVLGSALCHGLLRQTARRPASGLAASRLGGTTPTLATRVAWTGVAGSLAAIAVAARMAGVQGWPAEALSLGLLAIVLATALALHPATRGGPTWTVAAAATTLVVLAGHGGRSTQEAWVQSLHAVVLLTWAGALPTVARWAAQAQQRRQAILLFSWVATGAVVTLALTGSALAVVRLQSAADLWRTAYGQMVGAKVAVTGGILLLGLMAHRWVRRMPEPSVAPARRIRWEAAGALAVLVLTGTLAGLAVPADRPPAAPAYQDDVWSGDHHVRMRAWPAVEADGEVRLRPGEHVVSFRVEHRASDGRMQRLEALQGEALFRHRVLDMGAIVAPAVLRDGWYEVRGTQLGAIGPWEVVFRFTSPQAPAGAEARFEVDLGQLGHFHGGADLRDPHFDTGYLSQGERFTRVFTQRDVGLFECHCHPHQWMKCSIEVLAEGEPMDMTVRILGDASQDAAYHRFEPAELRLPAGSTVTWVNEGDVAHTATNVRWYPRP